MQLPFKETPFQVTKTWKGIVPFPNAQASMNITLLPRTSELGANHKTFINSLHDLKMKHKDKNFYCGINGNFWDFIYKLRTDYQSDPVFLQLKSNSKWDSKMIVSKIEMAQRDDDMFKLMHTTLLYGTDSKDTKNAKPEVFEYDVPNCLKQSFAKFFVLALKKKATKEPHELFKQRYSIILSCEESVIVGVLIDEKAWKNFCMDPQRPSIWNYLSSVCVTNRD